MLNIKQLFERGGEILNQEHAELEKTKVGNLRAGNTGLYDRQTGMVAGMCQRRTLLRYQGVDVQEEDEEGGADKHLMFEAGIKNEDSWYERLIKSWHGTILREEEIPISWQVTDSVKVTGRPDIILIDADNKPLHGIELKLISAVWTARDVLAGSPKTGHLMQAAHYSWQMGIPFSLCYTNRAHLTIPDFGKKLMPGMNQEGSQYCEYNPKGEFKKVLPFMKEFQLYWKDDVLFYRDGDTKKEVETIVTKSRIKDYFSYVLELEQKKELGPRPANLYPNGQKAGFDSCDYCPLQKVCDKYEDSYDKWSAEVRKVMK